MTIYDKAKVLLGKQVIVSLTNKKTTFDNEGNEYILGNGESVIAKGKFLCFGQMGEFVLEEEDGDIKYCWPMLDIREA